MLCYAVLSIVYSILYRRYKVTGTGTGTGTGTVLNLTKEVIIKRCTSIIGFLNKDLFLTEIKRSLQA